MGYFIAMNLVVGNIERKNAQEYLHSVNELKKTTDYQKNLKLQLNQFKVIFPLNKEEENALLKICYDLGLSPLEVMLSFDLNTKRFIKKMDLRKQKEFDIISQISKKFNNTKFSFEELEILTRNIFVTNSELKKHFETTKKRFELDLTVKGFLKKQFEANKKPKPNSYKPIFKPKITLRRPQHRG